MPVVRFVFAALLASLSFYYVSSGSQLISILCIHFYSFSFYRFFLYQLLDLFFFSQSMFPIYSILFVAILTLSLLSLFPTSLLSCLLDRQLVPLASSSCVCEYYLRSLAVYLAMSKSFLFFSFLVYFLLVLSHSAVWVITLIFTTHVCALYIVPSNMFRRHTALDQYSSPRDLLQTSSE